MVTPRQKLRADFAVHGSEHVLGRIAAPTPMCVASSMV